MAVGLAWNTSAITIAGQSYDEVWKDGDTNGFHAYVAYVLSRDIGVFVLASSQIDPTTQALGDAVLAALPDRRRMKAGARRGLTRPPNDGAVYSQNRSGNIIP